MNRTLIVCLVAGLWLTACGETPNLPRTRGERRHTPAVASGSWDEISEAPLGFYRPEEAFWIDDRFVVIAGSTVQQWHPDRDEWTVLATIPQTDDCEGCGYSEAAVWTGDRLLLWGGGFSYRAPGGTSHTGVSVELEGPITPLADAPIKPRWWHTALWTGKEMVVWGGGCGREECIDGGAYDPASDSWRKIAPAPVVGYGHTAVWTGDEMIVWGGSDDYESEGTNGCVTSFIADGAAYDPAKDSWRVLASSPLDPRGWHSAVWTGEEMVVWGGATGVDCDYAYPSDGAAYDPASDSWRPIASSPLSGRVETSAVWTGEEMIVWGGSTHGRSVTLDDGARFDASSGEWTLLPPAPINSRALHEAIWNGHEMIVWGGCCNETSRSVDSYSDGAVFHPANR